MEIIVSSVIGGQIVAEVGMERVLHQLIIEMRKSLKKQFANNSFDGLDKTKINIYISGDVSEYCTKSGITKCRYLRKKKEKSDRTISCGTDGITPIFTDKRPF